MSIQPTGSRHAAATDAVPPSAAQAVAARRALATAIRHLDAPLRTRTAEERVLSWLTAGDWKSDEEDRARALLDETDPILLTDLVIGGIVSWRQLERRAAFLLPADHPTRSLLEENAGV